MRPGSTRVNFLLAWSLVLLAKLALAATLQPFGDEAFYAQEARHPAWAYSDLPGLTAWLAWLGTAVAGPTIFAVRLPFVLLGSLLPWLVLRMARRSFGEEAGWQAGLLALLLPLGGAMGVLALPDVPMLLAALLALDAAHSLLRRAGWAAFAQLGFALALGALAHYRFAGVLLAGVAGLLLVREGRALFREPGLWLALLAGAAAWWPLLSWNFAHAGAGLDFHLVQRHPWQPQVAGAWWPLVQALVLTPLLFVLLVATLAEAWRRRRGGETAWPLLLGFGTVATAGYFLLGFFADTERVSFHWPLAGWLALCVAAPVVLARWSRWARRLTWSVAGLGLAALLSYLALVAAPAGRAWLAAGEAYADNLSGWHEVADAVRDDLRTLPSETLVVADNFMLGAQLSLALGREVRVLEHPLNAKHGRAVQLAQWGLLERGESLQGGAPVLLVVEDTARPLKARLDGYRGLCTLAGVLPPPRVLNVDQGRKRFLRFGLTSPAARADARAEADVGGQVATHAACVLPALAWIDSPRPGDTAAGELRIEGWALKSGAGLARVEVLLDGEVVAQASHGLPRPDVATYWGLPASDGDGFGFTAQVPLDGREPGRAWLALRLHATDGSVEDWPAVPLRLR